ncbi:hypothetical protein V7087_05220 [Neobacillus niacini]|uniref:hypothetical protein n=1 Tax=Neobacillus niacini TaxID=86668 RepID=UPI002FFDD368
MNDIEILNKQENAFSYNENNHRFEFLNIGLGDNLVKAINMFGNPQNKVNTKNKIKHSCYCTE